MNTSNPMPYLSERFEKSLENFEALLLAPKYGLLTKDELRRLSDVHEIRSKLINANLDIISDHISLEEARQCENALKDKNLEEFERILTEARSKIENFDSLYEKAVQDIRQSIS